MQNSPSSSASALLSRAGTSRLSWIAFGAAAIAALAISLATLLWFERDAQLENAGKAAEKLALALDRHTEATFDLVDSALRSAAGEMVTAVLPEIQDSMRQTLLGFRTDDLQTPDGVNRVRKAMTEHLNEEMTRVLGPERIAKMTDGSPNGAFVQNILFATLIVE